MLQENVLKRKPYGPFLWMEYNCLKVTEPLRGDILLATTNWSNWYSFHEPWKDEKLSRPWSN